MNSMLAQRRMQTLIALAILLSAAASYAMMRSGKADAATPATVAYRYDSAGNLIQDLYPANNLTYSYDAAKNRQAAAVQ